MVHLTDHMGGKTCCSLAVCAQFVQRKVILAYCELDKPYRTNMPHTVGWCLDAVPLSSDAAPVPRLSCAPFISGCGGCGVVCPSSLSL